MLASLSAFSLPSIPTCPGIQQIAMSAFSAYSDNNFFNSVKLLSLFTLKLRNASVRALLSVQIFTFFRLLSLISFTASIMATVSALKEFQLLPVVFLLMISFPSALVTHAPPPLPCPPSTDPSVYICT